MAKKIELSDDDWLKVDKMAGIFCTGEEIANVMGFSYDTLERRVKEVHGISCAEYIRQKSDMGRMSLRRKQYETASSGNITMLIWLGKQYLGQSDKQDQSISVNEKKLIIDMGDDDK